MRTNVLIHREKKICSIQPAEDGLSDSLFEAGVRVFKHCLNKTAALNCIKAALDASYEVYELDEFKEMVFEDQDDGARAATWVGNKSPFGETTDKGKTMTMIYQQRKWI